MRGDVVDMDLTRRRTDKKPGGTEGNGEGRYGLCDLDEAFLLGLEVVFVDSDDVICAESADSLHGLPSEPGFLLE